MQAPNSTDRLACAIFTGEKSIHRAVTLLVEAGFATESLSVVWCVGRDPSDEATDDDTPSAESSPTGDAEGGDADTDAGEEPDEPDEPDELDEAPVTLRTGVRRFLPVGAALGALGGILVTWFAGDPKTPLVPQIITALFTGGFLGAMGGIVLGLGQWDYAVELPDDKQADRPLLITVDVAAQGREPEASAALKQAGAALVKVCTREEAEQFVREAGAA